MSSVSDAGACPRRAFTDLEELLDLHYYVREEQGSRWMSRVIIMGGDQEGSGTGWRSTTGLPLPTDWRQRESSR